MNVIAVDGGPKRHWHRGALLKNALEGADSVRARLAGSS
jgi:hypothetical protein